RRAVSRYPIQIGMAPRGSRRQLVLQRSVQNGRLALSGAVQIFFGSPAGHLCESRAEKVEQLSRLLLRIDRRLEARAATRASGVLIPRRAGPQGEGPLCE